ncbi:integrase domain-containing protein [Paraburkholderia terrae]|uniref:Integrase n=1 Tax=Paraburkholderia terrae TaxID=311230 RepID=A0A2I8EL99_9BURK|nr:integrase domain-containing protein [Paraburkholderia terrae]AUT60239.1 integrase [Paraburkholderia terrae]
MGQKSRLSHASRDYSHYRGGAARTIINRWQLIEPLLVFLGELGIKVPHIRNTPMWAIALFVQTQLCRGVKAGHARNMTTAIRVLLDEAGAGIVNTACSNDALGVPRRNRKGARRAQTHAEFAQTIERARAIDEGLAHLLCLMFYLGLRCVEALRSARELQGWLALVRAGADRLPFQYGAKTNRYREIEIIRGLRAQTIRALESALEYCQAHNNNLITGADDDLRTARSRLRDWLYAAGIRGQLSSHSLRYSHAVNLALAHLDEGVSPETTVDRVSASLGHGARAQMILNTYLQEIRHLFASVVIPRRIPRKPAKTMMGRDLPGPQRMIRSNRRMKFRKA